MPRVHLVFVHVVLCPLNFPPDNSLDQNLEQVLSDFIYILENPVCFPSFETLRKYCNCLQINIAFYYIPQSLASSPTFFSRSFIVPRTYLPWIIFYSFDWYLSDASKSLASVYTQIIVAILEKNTICLP